MADCTQHVHVQADVALLTDDAHSSIRRFVDSLPPALKQQTYQPLLFDFRIWNKCQFSVCIGQSPYLYKLLINYHTDTCSLRSANTKPLSILTTFGSMVLVLQPPLCGTRSHVAFATLFLPIPSVTFLKLTSFTRLSAPPSGSPKCFRFGL